MPKLRDVCRHVRSKNAGSYWITVDLFFIDDDAYGRYADAPAIGVAALGKMFEVAAVQIKRFAVPDLNVVKLSYPRAQPQGGAVERDMHGGQQYVRLLDVEV